MTNNPTIDGVSRERAADSLYLTMHPNDTLHECERGNPKYDACLRAIDAGYVKAAPVVERQPDAIIEGCLTSVGITHAIYASTVTLKDKEQVRLYREPPELAALQSTNKQLTETIQHMIDQTIPLVPDENNPMWSRRITIDELQSTITQLQGRIAELESDEPEWSTMQQRLGDENTQLRSRIAELESARGEPFQSRVQPWMLDCFGPIIAGDRGERNHRFLEEALELVQACGASSNEAHQLVDYVYGRAVGEPAQEVGGVMVTLAALCLANGMDMHEAGETELARIWTKVEQIRAKQAAKPAMSPLPGAYPDRAPPAPVAVVLPERMYSLLPGADGWNACLDATAALNGGKS